VEKVIEVGKSKMEVFVQPQKTKLRSESWFKKKKTDAVEEI
jgi:hypothetical protein